MLAAGGDLAAQSQACSGSDSGSSCDSGGGVRLDGAAAAAVSAASCRGRGRREGQAFLLRRPCPVPPPYPRRWASACALWAHNDRSGADGLGQLDRAASSLLRYSVGCSSDAAGANPPAERAEHEAPPPPAAASAATVSAGRPSVTLSFVHAVRESEARWPTRTAPSTAACTGTSYRSCPQTQGARPGLLLRTTSRCCCHIPQGQV